MRFFSAHYSPAVTKVTKGLRSKVGAKSIFTTGLYFLPDSATHISFYFKQHFFFRERLQIFRYSAYIGLPYRITFRSSFLNLVLRPPRVRCNCKESGLAPSQASFCGIHFVPTRTSAFSRYFLSSTQQFLGLDAVMTAGVIKTDDGKKFQSVVI